MKICSIESCSNKHYGTGLCRSHYLKKRRYGDPLHSSNKVCSVEGCDSPINGNGLCGMHYMRNRRNGNPLIKSEKRPGYSHIIDLSLDKDWESVLLEFREASIDVQHIGVDTPCWEWLGPQNGKGYSRVAIMRDGKTIQFSGYRMVLEASLGRRLKNRMDAHHRCANKICVNPDHIQESTKIDNTAEMKARKWFLSRIQELEEALRELNPTHILL